MPSEENAFDELVEIYRAIFANEVHAGDFLRSFAEAFSRADAANKFVLAPAAFSFAVQYKLDERYKRAEEDGRITWKETEKRKNEKSTESHSSP